MGAESAVVQASEVLKNVFGSAPALSSERRAWPSVTVCLWQIRWLDSYVVPESDEMIVACHTGGVSAARTMLGGGWSDRCSGPGQLHMIPPGHRTAWKIDGALRFSSIHLPRSRIAAHAARLPGFRFAFRDAFVSGCVDTLVRELRQPRQTGTLYVDSVAEALSLHLLRSAGGRADPRRPAALRPMLARACELIEARIESGVALDELAAEAGVSRSHFLRTFKAATGLSPHRYLVCRRVERAKQLLLRSDLALADIALKAGFGSQSHFTDMFRAATGATPLRFRRGRHS
ncbi:MAG: helix-turn-helix transcriptional regulator [Nevskia sp.]|nr:helix-turn-helix transcriptional regulator [Nevskia sp.]